MLGKLRPFFTIGAQEKCNVQRAMNNPLSGMLGGEQKAGYWVEKLQYDWANEFNVEHAIACNSATSGLLAACMAAGIGLGDSVWVTSYSMSATAACAAVLGAKLGFLDIETDSYGIDIYPILKLPGGIRPKAIIVTNLFGCPARDLLALAEYCRECGIVLIEDNAQAPFAQISGWYTGTIGDIGVFSLNVHKHIQAGEGGVLVTNNTDLAERCWDAINHGELNKGRPGLNLRMTEPTAAIACAQLRKAHGIIERKIEFGQMLNAAVKGIDGYTPQHSRGRHVYYVWAAQCAQADRFAKALKDIGLPARRGYAPILTDVFGGSDPVPNARSIDERIVCVDCCQIDPSASQVIKLEKLVRRAAEEAR